MSVREKRVMVGAILIIAGLVGLIFALSTSAGWSNSYGSMMGGNMPMMGQSYQAPLKTVNGTVATVESMEIELNTSTADVEVHGPYWFWQALGVKEGDTVTAKGVFISMMDQGAGWHEELMPFEVAVNGKTYGDANLRIPVWMQGIAFNGGP